MRLALFSFMTVLLFGCPAEDDPEESGDGSGSAGTETGPTGCASLESPASDDIQLLVSNNRDSPIYLDVGCGSGALILASADGTAVFAADNCEAPTCGDAVAGDCSMACAACLPGVLRVEAGGVVESIWPGTVFDDRDVTDVCDGLCTDRCWQDARAPDGTYRLRTHVFLDCPESLDSCECPEGQAPPCFIEAYDGAVNAEERSVEFTMPSAGPIELAVD